MKRLIVCVLTTALLLTGCSLVGGSSSSSSRKEVFVLPESGAKTEDVDADSDSATANSAPHADLTRQQANGDIIYIPENLFIAQTNDIYINTEDYLGKTISYEGIFSEVYREDLEETLYYVVRYGPGCCGYDANAGFEIYWDGEYPSHNDWVEVNGILDYYEINGWQYLVLRVANINVLDERGAEYVSM